MSTTQATPRGYATVEQACEYLQVSRTTLRRRIADGTIPAYIFGAAHTLRIRWSDLDAALKPLATGADGGASA